MHAQRVRQFLLPPSLGLEKHDNHEHAASLVAFGRPLTIRKPLTMTFH
jgi:hypothetical protein